MALEYKVLSAHSSYNFYYQISLKGYGFYMKKEPEKYIPGGGLNPFWVEWDSARIRREEAEEQAQKQTEYLMALLDSIQVVDKSRLEGGVDCNGDDVTNKLEQQLQFLMSHKDSEEEFNLAKQLLGIKE